MMSKWVRDIQSGFLNLDHILRFEYRETEFKGDPAYVVVAHLVDGTSMQIIGQRFDKNGEDDYDVPDIDELICKRMVDL